MYFVDIVVSYAFVLLCSELISFSLCLLLCVSTMLVNKVDHMLTGKRRPKRHE